MGGSGQSYCNLCVPLQWSRRAHVGYWYRGQFQAPRTTRARFWREKMFLKIRESMRQPVVKRTDVFDRLCPRLCRLSVTGPDGELAEVYSGSPRRARIGVTLEDLAANPRAKPRLHRSK